MGQPDTHDPQAEQPLTLRTLKDSLRLLSMPDQAKGPT
jgi:hypothetical protein